MQLGAQPNINACSPDIPAGHTKRHYRPNHPVNPINPNKGPSPYPRCPINFGEVRQGKVGVCVVGPLHSSNARRVPVSVARQPPLLLAEGIWEGVCRAATAAMCASTVYILRRCQDDADRDTPHDGGSAMIG